MKKRLLAVIPLAAALILTGCSESQNDQSGPDSNNTQSHHTASSGQHRTTALDAGQVKTVVESLVGEAEGAQILDQDMIQSQLEQSKKLQDAVRIEPQRCKEILNDTSLADVGNSAQALGVVSSAGSSRTYQVISLTEEQLEKVKNLLSVSSFNGCEKLTQEVNGQTAELDMKILDARANADKTLAQRVIISSPETPGLNTVTVSVQALKDSNFVSASVTTLVQESGEETNTKATLDSLLGDTNAAFDAIAATS